MAKLDLSRFKQKIKAARKTLANQILIDCKVKMPKDKGTLEQLSYVQKDGKEIVFKTPYAHYLYVGKKMVNERTGKGPALVRDKYGGIVGLRYKKGTRLKYAEPEQKLRFTRPEAEAQWFEAAKKEKISNWIELANEEMKK